MLDRQPARESITWSGAESISRAEDAMRRGRAVQLELPRDVHHAVLSRLVADEDLDSDPVVEIQGREELIAELAAIDSLEPIAALSRPVREIGYRVAVTSAAPVILIEPAPRPPVTVPFRTPGGVV